MFVLQWLILGSDLLHVLLQFFKHLPMQPSILVSTSGLEGAVRAPLSEVIFSL